MKLDADLKSEEFSTDQGATSCVILITANQIYCANAGDSRGVLNCGQEAIPLSYDHKPDNPDELNRIRNSGHSVYMNRVDGNLALSRAFGDYAYKEGQVDPKLTAVTAFPDVIIRDRSN